MTDVGTTRGFVGPAVGHQLPATVVELRQSFGSLAADRVIQNGVNAQFLHYILWMIAFTLTDVPQQNTEREYIYAGRLRSAFNDFGCHVDGCPREGVFAKGRWLAQSKITQLHVVTFVQLKIDKPLALG